jgi:hypothetical protein
MAGLYKLLIQCPNDQQDAVFNETGFHTGADLFLLADPPIRPKWGGRTSTSFTAAQELLIPTWQADFPTVLFEKYHAVTQSGVPAQRLLDWGLTTSATD